MLRLFFVMFIVTIISSPISVFAEDKLKVGLLIGNKGQRDVYYKLARQFEAEYPDIKVSYIVRGDQGYKLMLEKWLSAENGLDVLYWQAGERLFQYARQDLIEPIDDVLSSEQWENSFTSGVKDAVSYEGKIYGLPFSYYHWGLYYKKSLFSKLKIDPPTTWEEFLAVCETLKLNGVSPIMIGSENHWPAAAWFDYLNLRINGLVFHQQLMSGKLSYTDDRVRKVFETWKVLIDRDYFFEASESIGWEEGLPYLYRELAGMTLIGNFVEQRLPLEVSKDIAFIRFPQVNESLPLYEEAPMEIFILSKNSKYKCSAKKFLAFMGRPDVQTILNQGLGYIPPNIHSITSDSYFVQKGSTLLKEAQGISQFYDRDTPKEMASVGIKVFSNFLKSGDIEAAIQKLERTRLRVFKIEREHQND